jgi:hypothetical protein
MTKTNSFQTDIHNLILSTSISFFSGSKLQRKKQNFLLTCLLPPMSSTVRRFLKTCGKSFQIATSELTNPKTNIKPLSLTTNKPNLTENKTTKKITNPVRIALLIDGDQIGAPHVEPALKDLNSRGTVNQMKVFTNGRSGLGSWKHYSNSIKDKVNRKNMLLKVIRS